MCAVVGPQYVLLFLTKEKEVKQFYEFASLSSCKNRFREVRSDAPSPIDSNYNAESTQISS